MNRIINIAYKNLDLSEVEYEADKNLSILFLENISQANVFKKNLNYLLRILSEVNCDYAFLKGAYLATKIYLLGQRTSNDIDILVDSEDVDCIQTRLLACGFVQGKYDRQSKQIIPATRERVIRQKMSYGQTVPLVKIYEGYPIEVDLNTSVDFKPEVEKKVVRNLLERKQLVIFNDYQMPTLNSVDFLIHLCCHLYKEATTFDWVKRRKDLCLYKFSDINLLLNENNQGDFLIDLGNRISKLGLEKECYYSFENSSIIYPNLNKLKGFQELKDKLKPDCLEFMNEVVYPREKKIFRYQTDDFSERFLLKDRVIDLVDITDKVSDWRKNEV